MRKIRNEGRKERKNERRTECRRKEVREERREEATNHQRSNINFLLVQGISKVNSHRSKRSAKTPLKPKIVELMLTADKPSYEFYGNRTMSFLVNVANMVRN